MISGAAGSVALVAGSLAAGQTYALIAAGVAIIFLLPRLTTAVPSPLVCVVVLTGVCFAVPMPVAVVADLGRLPDSLPEFAWPGVALDFATLRVVAPYALAMAVVGLPESMMTASVVDELTDTSSPKARGCVGLGLGNLAAGVVVGVLLSGVFFAFKVMRIMAVESAFDAGTGTRTCRVLGQVFFASADALVEAFDMREGAARVRIDLRGARLWDVTAVGALEGIVGRLRRRGVVVEVVGLDEASAALVARHGAMGE